MAPKAPKTRKKRKILLVFIQGISVKKIVFLRLFYVFSTKVDIPFRKFDVFLRKNTEKTLFTIKILSCARFKIENIEVVSLSYFDIASDLDIGKVDPDYLFKVLSKIDLSESDALFVSCTALPVLSLIDKLEKKLILRPTRCVFCSCPVFVL